MAVLCKTCISIKHNQYNYYIFKLHTLNGSTIEECTNSGTITAPRAGGILGSYVVAPGDECPTSDATSTITACTNSGNIVGPEAKCGVIAGMQISYAQGDSPSLFEYMKMIIK